ncbi:MAG TPA: hypothetical protein VMS96_04260 [Terriglobales bacterium]|nr:hypothetical protein [Terriglobales bacterium]
MKAWFAPHVLRWGAAIFAIILLGTLVSAQNVPVGKTYDLTLSAPARVGDVTLAAATYRVTHLMENGQHVMVFKGVRGDKKEYRATCKMRELRAVAKYDEQHFAELSAKERVLTSLVFAGDKVEHVF